MDVQWTRIFNFLVQNNPRMIDMPLKSVNQLELSERSTIYTAKKLLRNFYMVSSLAYIQR